MELADYADTAPAIQAQPEKTSTDADMAVATQLGPTTADHLEAILDARTIVSNEVAATFQEDIQVLAHV